MKILYVTSLLSLTTFLVAMEQSHLLLETQRLQIRYLTPEDAPSLIPILSDKDVMTYSITGPLTPEEINNYLHKKLLKSYKDYGWGRYALIKKDDKALIGYCGLGMQSLGDGKKYIDLGYKIAKKYWGSGYATEAACAIRDYACDVLKMPELVLITAASHSASINVAQKTGFQFWKEETFHSYPAVVYKIALQSKEAHL